MKAATVKQQKLELDIPFLDSQTALCVDSFERLKTPLSVYTEEVIEFAKDSKHLDCYQILGVLGLDTTDPEYGYKVQDAGRDLTEVIKNCLTSFEKDTYTGTRNAPDYMADVGILNKDDIVFVKALKEIFKAQNLLPHEDGRRMYDSDLGKSIVARIVAHKDQLTDLQILGIPRDQLKTDPNEFEKYVENAAALRRNQVFLASERLKPEDGISMSDCHFASIAIDDAKRNVLEDEKAAVKAEYTYQEFMDLIDMQGPVWDQVATMVGVKLEDLRLISRGTRKAIISLSRRHPGPLAVFIAVELVAPSVYENLPKELKIKLHAHAQKVKDGWTEFLAEVPGHLQAFGNTLKDGITDVTNTAQSLFGKIKK